MHLHRRTSVVLLWAVCLSLWLGRSHWTTTHSLSFLPWNLFLGAIPWLMAPFVAQIQRPGRFSIGVLAWWVWLPNAHYLMTDLIHLRVRRPVPWWYDLLLFSAFALTGCLMGWDALREVHGALSSRLTPHRVRLVLGAIVVGCAFGMSLGRFQRLNSWDVLRPVELFNSIGSAAASTPNLVFTATFALLIALGYGVVTHR